MEIGHSRRNRVLACAFALGAGTLIATTAGPRAGEADYQPKVLYSFCSQSNCTDGSLPHAGLIMDTAGNLYSTTFVGGANRPSTYFGDGGGTVFELTPNAAKTEWAETVLYSFCAQGSVSCTDGALPETGLIIDKAGNLYSTTSQGGADHDGGTVFELTPDAAKTTWTESVLYSFCSTDDLGIVGRTSCPDGATGSDAYAGLIMDKFGNLHGTARTGGNDAAAACKNIHTYTRGCGVVFELKPNTGKTKWRETVPYRFCSKIGCTDGSAPSDGLIMDKAGNLYGVTSGGGNSSGAGVVFELTPQMTGVPWKETVLYSFCSQPNCTDGDPNANSGSLIIDAEGNLYGMTALGGNDSNNGDGSGVVFKLAQNAAKTKWVETVLYNFCSQGGSSCTDGYYPTGGLIMDKGGNLYSTTIGGGANALGTVFELTHNAAKTKWVETVLYSFCAQPNCTDGGRPYKGVIMDKAENLYTTTSYGGAHGSGTVFELERSP
jgi:uncharacterized repeat protein (TIGR03803 family)